RVLKMSRSKALIEHQFDDIEQQRHAVTLGMWAFLATEVMFFGSLFLGFTAMRATYPRAFDFAVEHLNFWLGTVNTAVLLGSSLTMALAVHAAQEGRGSTLVKYLGATIGLGVVFLSIKAIEYRLDWNEQLVPGRGFHVDRPDAGRVELYFMFYFIMTG